MPSKQQLEASIALLKRLGARRYKLQQDEAQLTEDIRMALEVTRDDVNISDAAHYLGIHRTSLYRTYLKEGQQ